MSPDTKPARPATKADCAMIWARHINAGSLAADVSIPIALRVEDKEAFDAMPRRSGGWMRVTTTTGQPLLMRPAPCAASCYCAAEWMEV